MIKKIILPTLERFPERRRLNLKHLLDAGVPSDIIEYFAAYDYHNYLNDPNGARAVDEAYRTGWIINVQKAASYRTWKGSQLRYFCMRWTFTLIFKQIMHADNDAYYMFLVDDFTLKRPYDELITLLNAAVTDNNTLTNKPTPFILQLATWHSDEMPRIFRTPIPLSPYIGRGFSGLGDAGFILNPRGARVLYNRLCNTGGSHSLEGQLWLMSQEPLQPGQYSVMPNHRIIWWKGEISEITSRTHVMH